MGRELFCLKLEQAKRIVDPNDFSVLCLLVRAQDSGCALLGEFFGARRQIQTKCLHGKAEQCESLLFHSKNQPKRDTRPTYHCASLELAGYCDWRIPSQVELLSLSDPTVFSEPVETFADGVEATLAWAPGSDLWEVALSFHYWLRAAAGIADNPRSMRCVRQHFEYTSGQERFLIEGEPGEEVIVQPATGLKWESVTEVPRLGLADARAYCEGLTLDGGGFRLAGAKELFTLLDPLATEPPRIDVGLFPMTGDTENEGARAWTDTSNVSEWVLDLIDGGAFNYGGTITYRADSELRVFCVK